MKPSVYARILHGMHAEYTKLTNVIKQQHVTRNGLEKQLGTIITLLQSIIDSCAQQR